MKVYIASLDYKRADIYRQPDFQHSVESVAVNGQIEMDQFFKLASTFRVNGFAGVLAAANITGKRCSECGE